MRLMTGHQMEEDTDGGRDPFMKTRGSRKGSEVVSRVGVPGPTVVKFTKFQLPEGI